LFFHGFSFDEIQSDVLNTKGTHLPWYGSPALAGGARVSRTVPGKNSKV